jgi:hypothetical protein
MNNGVFSQIIKRVRRGTGYFIKTSYFFYILITKQGSFYLAGKADRCYKLIKEISYLVNKRYVNI